MNENQRQSVDKNPAVNDRILRTVKRQQRVSRVLTCLALLFGFTAIAASIALVVAYCVLYLPKQKQLLQDYQRWSAAGLHNYAPNPGDLKNTQQLAQAHILMTHVSSMGTMLVATSVGVLGGGTLVMLIVIVLNRRLTLSQINAALAQISAQIKELQSKPPG